MLLGDSGEHTHTATIHVRFEIASCIALPSLHFCFCSGHYFCLKCWSDLQVAPYAGAAEKLPEPPAQPSEAQLLELLKYIKGVYAAKPSRHVQGRSCCNLEM